LKNLSQLLQIWLNNTANSIKISVIPTQFTPNYSFNMTVQSPNGAVALDPDSLTTSTGKNFQKG
jgi:hypothetical protein